MYWSCYGNNIINGRNHWYMHIQTCKYYWHCKLHELWLGYGDSKTWTNENPRIYGVQFLVSKDLHVILGSTVLFRVIGISFSEIWDIKISKFYNLVAILFNRSNKSPELEAFFFVITLEHLKMILTWFKHQFLSFSKLFMMG
jgi:hypothetical protein